jgi:cell wall-associated NlpC family hydrolase
MYYQEVIIKSIFLRSALWIIFGSCLHAKNESTISIVIDSIPSISRPVPSNADTPIPQTVKNQLAGIIETGKTKPADLVAYSKTLLGVPYKYASIDPAAGFDCSGFITYVFNHFKIAVPRSSIGFIDVGDDISSTEAKPGDLILFTGTDSTIRTIGHMGIIVSNKNGELAFIHSTSGKAKGVVITPFENYYKSRFVKVIRVFPFHSF